MKRKRPATLTSEQWNAKYSTGTRVRYFPILGGMNFIETTTRSEAWEMGGETVVMIEGKSGGCAIGNMQVIRR